jgi:hypothetical protein
MLIMGNGKDSRQIECGMAFCSHKKSTINVCFIKISVPTSYETLCPFLIKKNSLLICGEKFRFTVGIIVTR